MNGFNRTTEPLQHVSLPTTLTVGQPIGLEPTPLTSAGSASRRRARLRAVHMRKLVDFGDAADEVAVAVKLRGRNVLTDDDDGVTLTRNMAPDFVAIRRAGAGVESATIYTGADAASAKTLSSLAAGSRVVIGFRAPFDELVVTVGSANGTAGAARVRYLKTDGEYATLAAPASDGTATGGATLAQTGTVGLFSAVPVNWAASIGYGRCDFLQTFGFALHLVEFESTGAFDSSTVATFKVHPLVGARVPLLTLNAREIGGAVIEDINVVEGNEVPVLVFTAVEEDEAAVVFDALLEWEPANPLGELT